MKKDSSTAPRYAKRKLEIVACATRLINSRGLGNFTIADVAREIGIVATGVWYYFKTKDLLAAACYKHAIEEYQQLLADSANADRPAQRVESFLMRFTERQRKVALGETHQICYFDEISSLEDPDIFSAYGNMFRSVRGLLDLRPSTEERVGINARTHLLLSQILWMASWIEDYDPREYGRIAKRAHDILFNGLAAPGSACNPVVLPYQVLRPPVESSPYEAYLQAATQLINEKGAASASVNNIAAKLNVTKGGFYHHIESKEDLITACFERSIETMWNVIEAAEASSETALQALTSIAATLLQYRNTADDPLLRQPALATLGETTRTHLNKKYHHIAQRFASLICDGMVDGSIRPLDANVASTMLVATIMSAGDLRIWVPTVTAETVFEQYGVPMFRGIFHR
ncbi:TetR/AcrR family transcriptional regulator [Noviherbaspirillum sp. Root189]|uniref:TetR/AcrR family transcriptional regulator n=1 Tax=Noviherbaspirillum sp. Root189 TaxID=1736487 RepID=UPI00070B3598|nr:TetR/AcrR family transcriptional regulator [Noviherbaspirillum sp. Root189]KRB82164.1 hypothetical protein ASE07_24010 [Noviherbaspirillum sp. Root189]